MGAITIEVLEPGLETTVQSLPGRSALTSHGYSASGPMDHLCFRAANNLVGNDSGAAALEVPRINLALAFLLPTQIAVTGPPGVDVFLNDAPIPAWQTIDVRAGDILRTVRSANIGFRLYLAVSGGIDVPEVYGSAATSLVAGVGGVEGRALVRGDQLPVLGSKPVSIRRLPRALQPTFSTEWEIEIIRGPHATPDYLSEEGWADLLSKTWRVDLNSDRIATRLNPYRLQWTHPDSSVSGGHPSNILDSMYPRGGVLANGDVLTILGADRNTSGGFACVATVPHCALWKAGQLRPGQDELRFREIGFDEAHALNLSTDFGIDAARLQTVV